MRYLPIVPTMFALLIQISSLRADEATPGAKPSAQIYSVAVLPFAERGSDVRTLGAKLTDVIFATLSADPNLILVDREDLGKVVAEQELNLSGAIKPDEATKVGQLTGAKLLVTGSVQQIDSSLYVTAKVIGTETTRVAGTMARGKAKDDLAALGESLAEKIGKTIANRGLDLVAKPVTHEDRVALLKKKLGGAQKLPKVAVSVIERHVGQAVIDPAAETELLLLCTETGFKAVEKSKKKDADVVISGEGFSEFAVRHGNLISVKARLEVTATDPATGKIIATDRQTSVALDLTEQIAGKTALQNAAASIAERLLPKLAQN